MAWRAADNLIRLSILVLAAALLYDGYQLLRAVQLNRAMLAIEAGEPVDARRPELQFANAFRLQQDGEFEPALKAYAAIDVPEGHRLRQPVRYNLANLYFRRGLEYREQDADDLALPLIELGKEYYRELLRVDSGHWASKYNLELALRVAPENDPEPVEEERNPEHNPRSAAGMQIRKRLP